MSERILLVDDDAGVRDVVAFTLRREGFDVDEERGELRGRWEAADARGQVRVRLPAGQDAAENRHDAVEPHAVERRERAARCRDLEDPEPPAGLQHAPQLTDSRLEVRDVADPEPDHGDVEARVRERQREHVAFDERHAGGLAPRALEHRSREVEADDTRRTGGAGRNGEVARPAARVEDAVARPYRFADRRRAPALVEPRRHDAVHRVVDGCDAVEHRAHRVRCEGHACPHLATRLLSIPSWSRIRATTNSTRSSTDSAPW